MGLPVLSQESTKAVRILIFSEGTEAQELWTVKIRPEIPKLRQTTLPRIEPGLQAGLIPTKLKRLICWVSKKFNH